MTDGLHLKHRARALRASIHTWIMLIQLLITDITTAPWVSRASNDGSKNHRPSSPCTY
ncbi:hypothetical protein N4P55_12485 [Pseudomonas fluorescens]|uniref:hypothetical protein n=1 Tax=Pseudomonas fluorescens TaxID=294 RepID=UPI0021D24CB4|nr:hypothetical protein [Pseudomonas fluorescens]UXV22131.1 hypothetical protein N4P55_12485 [Pseudomonas fluorescens]